MRDIKVTYNHIKNIRSRADTIIKDLEKRDLLDDEIEEEILSAQSLDALDHLVSDSEATFFFIYFLCTKYLLICQISRCLVRTIQSGKQIVIV